METVEINSTNFKQYQNLDIIAFSFAHPGAQGEAGGIKIMTSDGILYHTNYKRSITLDDAFLVCPPLKECKFELFGGSTPEGWISFYVGGGNFLVVRKQFEDTITGIIPIGVYNNWIEAMHRTTQQKNIMK